MYNFEIRLRGQCLGAALHVELAEVPTPNIFFIYWMEFSGSRCFIYYLPGLLRNLNRKLKRHQKQQQQTSFY